MNLRGSLSRIKVIFEDQWLTAPSSNYHPAFNADSDYIKNGLAALSEQGHTAVGPLFTDEDIRRIRDTMDKIIAGESNVSEVEFSERVQYYRFLQPLRVDPSLIRAGTHPDVLALVERYFQRKPYIADVDMRRILPVNMESLHQNEYSSSNWHRDTRGRQLKMMIYLTDVSEEDSNFSLLPTTHHGNFARKATYQESRFSDAEVNDMSISPQEWLGKAGDAQLFDTNLIHRLRRKSTSAVRDTVTFYYTPGQAMTRLDVSSADLGPTTKALFADPDWPLKRVDY